jgi:hypothetical protein
MNSLKNSGSTNLWNPGTLLRCGAESPRTTTNHGVEEPKNKQPAWEAGCISAEAGISR